MRGNGVFMFYWGAGEAPESWSKGFVTAKEAASHAIGHRPNGDYSIIEADRIEIEVPAHSLFNAEALLKGVERENPAAWPAGIPIASEREITDLEAKLGDCLDRWLRKHGYDGTTAFHTIRINDYFPEKKVRLNG